LSIALVLAVQQANSSLPQCVLLVKLAVPITAQGAKNDLWIGSGQAMIQEHKSKAMVVCRHLSRIPLRGFWWTGVHTFIESFSRNAIFHGLSRRKCRMDD
jgi:hypothetical protein